MDDSTNTNHFLNTMSAVAIVTMAFAAGFFIGIELTPRLTQRERAALKAVSPWAPPGVDVADVLEALEKRL